MAVKLDVSVNWISNIQDLQKEVRNINTRLFRVTRSFSKDYSSSPLLERIHKETLAMKQYDNVFNKVYADLDKLNKKGELSQYLGTMFTGRWNQKKLNPEQLKQLAYVKTEEEIERISKQQEHDEEMAKRVAQNEHKAKLQIEKDKESKYQERLRLFMQGSKERFNEDLRNQQEKQKHFEENTRRFLLGSKERFNDDLRAKKQERINQSKEAVNIEQRRKLDIKRNIQHSKALEENKKRDEVLRKKQWMLMLGKWGKFGVWGLVAQQAIKYVSRAIGYAYQTSMEGLDWERTIRGGASGGSWFGQGLAAYQRAGIGKANYQNFKRGIQSYLGAVKLGTGNAAPLMWLGLNALDNPDEIERQMERALRRAPKDESLAMAGMLGLDYNMWEAIYSGRINRERSAYSEDAIKSWARLADSLNVLVTNLNTFFFNNLAPIADFVSRFLDNTVNKQTDWERTGNLLQWWINPSGAIARNFGQMVRFGAVEVIFKNENGDVVDRKFSEAGMEYNLEG